MSEKNKVIVTRYFEEIWNRGDLAVADQIFAPNFINHDPSNPNIKGPEGIKEHVSMYRTAYPDVHMSIEDMIVEGQKVVTRWTARATHLGTLKGISPTGKKVVATGTLISHINIDKIEEDWSNWKMLEYDEEFRKVEDKINQESIRNLWETITTKLEASNTLFRETEARVRTVEIKAHEIEKKASDTVEHVATRARDLEDTVTEVRGHWKKSKNIVSGLTAIVAVLTVSLGVFGITKLDSIYKDACDSKKAIEIMEGGIREKTLGIQQIKAIRETKIELGAVKESLCLDDSLNKMSQESLIIASKEYKASMEVLENYTSKVEKYEPEAVLLAIEMIFQLVNDKKYVLSEKKEKDRIHSALLTITGRYIGNWRLKLGARKNIIEFKKILKDDDFVGKNILAYWYEIVDGVNLENIKSIDKLDEEAAIILAMLGEENDRVKKILRNILKKKSIHWPKLSAAVALIKINDAEGVKYIDGQCKKYNVAGLWADLFIGRYLYIDELGEEVVTDNQKYNDVKKLGDSINIKMNQFDAKIISRRINEKLDEKLALDLNSFAKKYASNIANLLK